VLPVSLIMPPKISFTPVCGSQSQLYPPEFDCTKSGKAALPYTPNSSKSCVRFRGRWHNAIPLFSQA
jgi:hypothetical protein